MDGVFCYFDLHFEFISSLPLLADLPRPAADADRDVEAGVEADVEVDVEAIV